MPENEVIEELPEGIDLEGAEPAPAGIQSEEDYISKADTLVRLEQRLAAEPGSLSEEEVLLKDDLRAEIDAYDAANYGHPHKRGPWL